MPVIAIRTFVSDVSKKTFTRWQNEDSYHNTLQGLTVPSKVEVAVIILVCKAIYACKNSFPVEKAFVEMQGLPPGTCESLPKQGSN